MRDKIFYTICFGFIFGVFLRTFISVDLYYILLLTILSIAVILFFTLISKDEWGRILGFFALAIILGIIRFSFTDVKNPNTLEVQVGQKIEISGIITNEPNIGEDSQKFILKTNESKVLVSTDFSLDYKYGDEVRLSGKLQKPENFVTDYGKEFDYVNYLRKDGIL